jgi:regulatory protein YycH of two-component signal transduction system YycFG
MESKKDNSSNTRFYILLTILLILSVIISYFNLKVTTVTPTFENANYDNILKHIKMLKKSKKYT